MNVFDYVGSNTYIQLKSRNNNYNKFPTTMIGFIKIKKASTLIEVVFFVFFY